MEGLTKQLQRSPQTLEEIGYLQATELLLVGGGSRNILRNQIRVNVPGIPVEVLDDAETTMAGAAVFIWSGIGEFTSPEQVREQVRYQYHCSYPQTESELTGVE